MRLVEYVLTTSQRVSGSVAQGLRDTFGQALSSVTGPLQQLAPDARRFVDPILGNPIGAAIGIGVLVLVVGLLLVRRC